MKMKREYTKPVVELVRFELNEAIAACDVPAHNLWNACKDPNPQYPKITFQDQDACNGSDPLPEGYCYYTVNAAQTFFNSL